MGSSNGPSEESFYDILGVAKEATPTEIKKAYYRLSKQWHPDKNPENKEESTARFQKISEAYQVLSDPELREKYDKFGKAGLERHSFVDPGSLFSMMFGGGKFEHLVGELQMAFLAKNGLDEEGAAGPFGDVDEPELQSWQEERVKALSQALAERLDQYVQGNEQGFALEAFAEKEELMQEPMGRRMLATIGYSYQQAAKAVLARRFEQGGILRGLRSAGLRCRRGLHKVGAGISAVSGAAHTAAAHRRLQKRVEALGGEGLTEERMQEDPEVEQLTQQLAEGLHEMLWRVSRFDVEATIEETVQVVATESGISEQVLRRRCEGLLLLGGIFQEARPWRHPSAANRLPSSAAADVAGSDPAEPRGRSSSPSRKKDNTRSAQSCCPRCIASHCCAVCGEDSGDGSSSRSTSPRDSSDSSSSSSSSRSGRGGCILRAARR